MPVIKNWFDSNRTGKENEILIYYSDDAAYKIPKENLALFNNLDKPYSEKRVVLLVAVGTEGWDCRSLTGVVLPRQKTTKNFVLQTTCRCLREVEKAKDEKALIFLEPGNYDTLDKELRENYQLTIADLKIGDEQEIPVKVRKPKLGKLKYKQVCKQFKIEIKQESKDFAQQLKQFDFEKFKKQYAYEARETTGTIGRTGLKSQVSERIAVYAKGIYTFQDLIYDLAKTTYNRFSETDLMVNYRKQLIPVNVQIIENYDWISNHPQIEMQDVIKYITSFFAVEIEYKSEIITEDTVIELLEWELPAGIDYGNGKFLPPIEKSDVNKIKRHSEMMDWWFEEENPDPNDISFNHIPYRFDSDFEKNAILQMLQLGELKDLEVYFNGYKDDKLQNFCIKTYYGNYTPDFLILKRNGGKKDNDEKNNGNIEKVLIIETKGKPYYTAEFRQKEKFVNEVFSKHNPQFQYVCFKDEGKNDFTKHLTELKNLITELQESS